MIKIENVEVMGWEAAIRGMRNPMNSWGKSDSVFVSSIDGDWYTLNESNGDTSPFSNVNCFTTDGEQVYIGSNDLDLMMRLRNAGTDHRKFMRMINVYVDIIAPLYWWKEFDTYKVGTVANSCSTMHKIHEREFTLEDFSCEHLIGYGNNIVIHDIIRDTFEHEGYDVWSSELLDVTIMALNIYRQKYLETKDKKYWWQMIQLLPSSYNQRRTVMLNYEVLTNMYFSRINHKLDEWVDFCKWIETLPYFELITGER